MFWDLAVLLIDEEAIGTLLYNLVFKQSEYCFWCTGSTRGTGGINHAAPAAGGVREGRSAEEETVDSGGVPAYI